MFIQIHLKYNVLDFSFSDQSTATEIPGTFLLELLNFYLCLVKTVMLSLSTL